MKVGLRRVRTGFGNVKQGFRSGLLGACGGEGPREGFGRRVLGADGCSEGLLGGLGRDGDRGAVQR